MRFQFGRPIPAVWNGRADISALGVDIKESNDTYDLSFEIPGAIKQDVKIWLEGNILTVSAEKKEDSKDGERKLHSERVYGKFERAFRLPDDIDGNKVKADFVNGILNVTIPKSAKDRMVDIEIE